MHELDIVMVDTEIKSLTFGTDLMLCMVQHSKLLAPPVNMWIQQSFNGWLTGTMTCTDTISWVSTNTFLS